ncbi:MAG: carboxypeptidase-like regulatory domain-containing protein [Pedobacter sp.]|nr:carboxypeptidase-like regulatory domain-containing protein [Pedobacter sp.]MDQ8053661.1 carboxypeptidase-like regulatory domain-containing protein [Pedobacter sp.]
MHKHPLLSLTFFLLVFTGLNAAAQQDADKAKIISSYDSLNRTLPKERLAVHLDKTNYLPLDTIWFKAYLFDGTLKTAATNSGLIYVELIDSKGNVAKRISLPTGAGLTWGGIALNAANYKPGTYLFRAYTNWMRNFGERYFFKKEIRIIDFNLDNNVVSAVAKSNPVLPSNPIVAAPVSRPTAVDLQFMPEGGNWIAGWPQKMGFKALNPAGKGMEIAGDIVDSKQQKVASFSSSANGMGYFILTPKPGETYTAIVKSPLGVKDVALPKTITIGTSLQVAHQFSSDSITINVHSDLADQELLLLGQARELLCFVVKIKANVVSKSITLPKNIFPTGISQIVLTNIRLQPLNERSFFVDHHDQLNIDPVFEKTVYGNRDSIPMLLKVTDAGGNPLVGSFSMAVTDDGQVSKDMANDANILSYLLLNADLKGEIENPGSYFHELNEKKHAELEALMLTQGWASYPLLQVVKPKYRSEVDFAIRGKVSNLTNKAISKANVSLFGSNKKKVLALQTIANEQGEFIFEKLPPLDSASLVIQALNTKGKSGTLGITVFEPEWPNTVAIDKKQVLTAATQVNPVTENLVRTQKQQYRGEGVALQEVNIKGKRAVKNSKNLNGPGDSDQVISEEDLAKVYKKTLYEVLFEKVPGFHFKIKRGTNDNEFYIKSDEIKIVIDGLDLDYFYEPFGVRDSHFNFIKDYLMRYAAEDLLGVEIMNTNSTVANYNAMYAPDQALNKAMKGEFFSYLEITTKTGSGPFLKKTGNMYLYRPPTYGDLKVFYSPKYTSENKGKAGQDLRSTIFWVPNLITNEKGEAKTSFFSADKKGTYTVWIEGTDMQGKIGFKSMKLTVE